MPIKRIKQTILRQQHVGFICCHAFFLKQNNRVNFQSLPVDCGSNNSNGKEQLKMTINVFLVVLKCNVKQE